MNYIKIKQTEDGRTYSAYDIIGENKYYSYSYEDVTRNENEAKLLDLILSSGYIPEHEADDFTSFFIEYITNK